MRKRKGFAYRGVQGRWLGDPVELARIRKLAITPACISVWICASTDGHLQATGRDARGRKQYRYHALWRQERDSGKFKRLLAFAPVLPLALAGSWRLAPPSCRSSRPRPSTA